MMSGSVMPTQSRTCRWPTITNLVHLLPKAECLNENLFRDLAHARHLIGAWVTDYNTRRPHSALGYQRPPHSPRCANRTGLQSPLHLPLV
ncbi:transposase [Henriciella mobilis]|uniref:Transposase n=1 Tax=Henriciella mobilis TaxID=2305467 RepID=A0A399RUP8_9PROT|nr:transposase [Henriciella mobilis]